MAGIGVSCRAEIIRVDICTCETTRRQRNKRALAAQMQMYVRLISRQWLWESCTEFSVSDHRPSVIPPEVFINSLLCVTQDLGTSKQGIETFSYPVCARVIMDIWNTETHPLTSHQPIAATFIPTRVPKISQLAVFASRLLFLLAARWQKCGSHQLAERSSWREGSREGVKKPGNSRRSWIDWSRP